MEINKHDDKTFTSMTSLPQESSPILMSKKTNSCWQQQH